MVKKIAGIVAALMGTVLILAVMQPDSFTVQRSTDIEPLQAAFDAIVARFDQLRHPEAAQDVLQTAPEGDTSALPVGKVMVSRSMRRTLSRRRAECRTSSIV